MSGDTIVALIGIVMAAAILSRNSRIRALPTKTKFGYAAIWVALFIGGTILASLLSR